MKKLNRKKAIELITPVIDGESTDEEARVLFDYMKKDEHVRKLYEAEQEMKMFVRNNYISVSTPQSINKFAKSIAASSTPDDNPYNEYTSSQAPNRLFGNKTNYFWISAAAIIIISLTYLMQPDIFSTEADPSIVIVEEQVGEHYNRLISEEAEPEITHPDQVSRYINNYYDTDIPVPELANVSFKGVKNSEFISDYDTPLFSYLCPNNHPIYVFAFDMEQMDERVKPDEEAEKSCSEEGSYHVTETDEHKLVSWREDNIWYAAISHHNEERYAEMLGQ